MINLDEVRPLEFAVDKVDASGSIVALDSGTLAALESITVQNGAGGAAVNIQDGGNSITVDGTVELGATSLAALESITVQNGAGASAVNIQDGGNSITVDGTVELGATTLAALETITVIEGAYNTWKATNDTATTTAAQLVGTPLANRINITIQNLGAQDVFIGQNNAVTAATGTKIAKFSSFSEKLGSGAAIWAITASGSADLRISEFAP